MFSKTMTRVIAAVVAMTMLAGCAEFDRRGGIVAEIQDNVLFVAHTKSHRLFRSYLLAGVLVAAARQGGHNEADKNAILANLTSVLEVALEAYNCLYPDPKSKIVVVGLAPPADKEGVKKIGTAEAIFFKAPAICQFFDEKMARLDYALFRLALSSLFNPQSNTYLSDIRDKLIGKIPVLSSTAKAAIYANKAVNETTTIVDDLLNLSFSSAGPVLTLLPLYRDSLEINMWLIIDNLTRFCGAAQPVDPEFVDGKYVPSYSLDDKVCATLGYALKIMNNGNGYLPDWREFVRTMNYATRDFDAYTAHFFLVTKLIWRSCTSFLASEAKCGAMLSTNGLFYDASLPNFILGPGDRIYSAKVRPSTQFARRPGPVPADTPPKVIAAPPSRDVDPTGSINQPKPPVAPAAPPAR